MICLSALRNRPVIYEEKKVGLVQGVSVDQMQKAVRALIVTCGLHGKRIILAQNICSLNCEFILANQITPYSRSFETVPLGFARDTAGLLVGKVTDFMIDESSMKVAAVEIIRGYLPFERRFKVWVYSYSASQTQYGEIIVPNDLSGGLCERKEETQICAFQP